MSLRNFGTAVSLSAGLLVLSSQAQAQEPVIGGILGMTSGAEGGDPGSGEVEFRRSRTRVFAAADVRSDEDMRQGWGALLYFDVEPRTAVGASVRYFRYLSERVVPFAGLTSAIAPHVLVGPELGLQVRIPVGAKASLLIEPSISALPFGTDLPGDRPILWGLLSLGVHAPL